MTAGIGSKKQKITDEVVTASPPCITSLCITSLSAALVKLSKSFLDVSSSASLGMACKHFRVIIQNDAGFLFIRNFFTEHRLQVGPVLNGAATDFQLLVRAQREKFLASWYGAVNATKNLRMEHTLWESRGRFTLRDAHQILGIKFPEKLQGKNPPYRGIGVGHLFGRGLSLFSSSDAVRSETPVDVGAAIKQWNAFVQASKALLFDETGKLESYALHMLSFQEAFGAEKVIQKWALLLDEFIKLLKNGAVSTERQKAALIGLSAWAKDDLPAKLLQDLINLFNSLISSSGQRLPHELTIALPEKIGTPELLVYETMQAISARKLETLIREYFEDHLPKGSPVLAFYKDGKEVTADGVAWILCHIGFLEKPNTLKNQRLMINLL